MKANLNNVVVLNRFSNSSTETNENPKWSKFIGYLNSKHMAGFSGGCFNEYYGVVNDREYVDGEMPADAEVMTLDDAIDVINFFYYNDRGKTFYVQRPSQAGDDWSDFISELNKVHNMGFDGEQNPGAYGIQNGYPKCIGERGMANLTFPMLDIEQGARLLKYINNYKEHMENKLVTTFDGLELALIDCVILDDASEHAGEYAVTSETVYSRVHGGHILQSEAAVDYRRNYFVEEEADNIDYVYSDWNDAWICTNWNDVHYGYTSYRNEGYFLSDDYTYINGEYYVNDEVANECGYYYDSDDDEWHHESEDRPVSSEPYNISYHSDRGREFRAGNAKFTIGVEVEKEDNEACTLHWRDVLDKTGWVKEKDGSLGRNGYELVSPVFDLFNDGMEKEIEASIELQTLIDAEYSDSCGGHINLGSSEYTPAQLFEGLSAFMPLLYAMYPNRVGIHFCQAKPKYKYRSVTSDYEAKYSSVYIKDKVVEFRIFPAVRSISNLLWRRDLVRIMCDNINKSELDVLKMLVNQNSKLYKHLRKIYSQDILLERTKQFITYTERFNDKKLPPINPKKLNRGDDNITGSTNDLGA